MMLCIVCNFIFMFQERCVAVDTISLVARILNRSKAHLQSMLLQSNSTVLEDFFVHLVCGILILKLQWLNS